MHQRLISVVCALAVVSQPGSVAASERASAVASQRARADARVQPGSCGSARRVPRGDRRRSRRSDHLPAAGRRGVGRAAVRAGDHHGRRLSGSGAVDAGAQPRRTPRSTRRSTTRCGARASLSEERLRRNPDDAEAHYLVGAADGFLASYAATVEGHVLGSLGPARRAYREHERVLELDPARKDAGLIVGLVPLRCRLAAGAASPAGAPGGFRERPRTRASAGRGRVPLPEPRAVQRAVHAGPALQPGSAL